MYQQKEDNPKFLLKYILRQFNFEDVKGIDNGVHLNTRK